MKTRLILILLSLALTLSACGRQATEQPTGSSDAPDGDSVDSETQKPSEAVSQGGFEVEEMRVVRDGLSIYGKIYTPVGADGKIPAVILSHSANVTSDTMKSYCERIAAQGLVAYAFDFCGGSKNSRSDGDVSDMTVFTEVEDLKAVLKAVSELDCVDSQSIFLFGTSQGGLVSAITAAECPSEVQGLILFYPGFNIAQMAQKYGGSGALDNPYISTLQDYDVYEHIGSFEGDVLILHGTMDFIVPCSYSKKAAQIYEHCELHLIKGASHGFNAENYAFWGNYDKKTWSYAEAFLAEHTNQE